MRINNYMNDKITTIINVKENEIRVMRVNDEDYISLTDLVRYKNPNNPSDVIKKWLSNYDSIEFLGLWEELSNENFNSAEFSQIKSEAPKKSFTMTPSQWCTRLNAIARKKLSILVKDKNILDIEKIDKKIKEKQI